MYFIMQNIDPTRHDTDTMSAEAVGQLETGLAAFRAWVENVTQESGSYDQQGDGMTVFAHRAPGAVFAGASMRDDENPGYRSLRVYGITPEDRWVIIREEDNYSMSAPGGHWKYDGVISIDRTDTGYVVKGMGDYAYVGDSDKPWSKDAQVRNAVGLLNHIVAVSEEI